MTFPIIRVLRSGDCEALAGQLTPIADDLAFADAYIAQLQDERQVWIAVAANGDGDPHYVGYAQVVWTSPQTYFWRRNIPQLTGIAVQTTHRQRGIGRALLQAVIEATQKRRYTHLGVHLPATPDNAIIRHWLTLRGFTPCADNAHLCYACLA